MQHTLRELVRYPYRFVFSYLPNHVVSSIPFYSVRHFYYRRVMGMVLGDGSSVHMGTTISGSNIRIGAGTAVNRNCHLDGRGGLLIGSNVSISPHVHLITASHSVESRTFDYLEDPIVVKDQVWIGTRATVLPGVTLEQGAVVAAGAVVSRDVPAFTVVGGVPARKIGERRRDLDYDCRWMPLFD